MLSPTNVLCAGTHSGNVHQNIANRPYCAFEKHVMRVRHAPNWHDVYLNNSQEIYGWHPDHVTRYTRSKFTNEITFAENRLQTPTSFSARSRIGLVTDARSRRSGAISPRHHSNYWTRRLAQCSRRNRPDEVASGHLWVFVYIRHLPCG